MCNNGTNERSIRPREGKGEGEEDLSNDEAVKSKPENEKSNRTEENSEKVEQETHKVYI